MASLPATLLGFTTSSGIILGCAKATRSTGSKLRMRESLGITGEVLVQAHDKHGDLYYENEGENLVTIRGKYIIAASVAHDDVEHAGTGSSVYQMWGGLHTIRLGDDGSASDEKSPIYALLGTELAEFSGQAYCVPDFFDESSATEEFVVELGLRTTPAIENTDLSAWTVREVGLFGGDGFGSHADPYLAARRVVPEFPVQPGGFVTVNWRLRIG